jgi:putative transposase
MVVVVKRIERVRIYPNARQSERLRFALDVTRQLYNALLQHRRDAYRSRGIRVTGKMQYAELTALRSEDACLAVVYRECEDAVLHRLDIAMAAFFRRLARGEKPGYPRFKSRDRWNQLEFPHGGRALKFNAAQTKVRVPGTGSVRLRKGRAVPDFGRAWIVHCNGRWYASFECERVVQRRDLREGVLGVDRGVHVLAATSEGRLLRNPRFLKKARIRVERLQRTVSRRKRGGRNRRRAAKMLARAHERVANARRDAMHKLSRAIVNTAPAVIALEALKLRNMTRSAKGTPEKPGVNVRAKAGLNRALLDSSFGLLQQMIASKAEEAGIGVVAVDPQFSSQECLCCGHIAAESRRKRRFACVRCGFCVHADVNAALVIRRRAELRPAGRGAALADLDDLRSVPPAGVEPARRNQEVAA